MKLKLVIKIGISVLFAAWLAFKIDVPSLIDILLTVKPELYIAATLLLFVNSVVLALKYRLVMRPSGIYQPLLRLVKINFICRFYSMFLTTAVGQGVIRWHISTKNQAERIKFISVMVFERSTFLLVLLFTVLFSSFFIALSDIHTILNKLYPFLIIGLVTVLLYFFYLSNSGAHRFIKNLFLTLPGKTKNRFIAGAIDWLSADSIFYKRQKMLAGSLIIAFVWQFLFLVRVYLLSCAIDTPLGFGHIAWMASMVLLLQLIPITLSGIGLREGAYAYLFRIQDLPPESGAALGILLLSHILLMAVAGGLIVLFFEK